MTPIPDLAGTFSRTARLGVNLSLNARILLVALAALALSAALGAAFAMRQAQRAAHIELGAAMTSAAHIVQTAPRGAKADPAQLAGLFDGNRHVSVAVLGADGKLRAASTLFTADTQPPAWFAALLDPHLPGQRIALAGGATAVLTPDPANEIGEDWNGWLDASLVGLVFLLAAGGLSYLAVSRALAPLAAVAQALKRAQGGDFGGRIAPRGPPEVAALASGFNAMAEQLAAADEDNGRLQAEILRLQEDERADFARDLHDEIGPYLFAVAIDAAAMKDAAEAKGLTEVAERAGLIGSAVGHMQGRVRDLLARLRPLRAVELGLAPALEGLADFWRARRAGVAFDLRITDDADIPLSPEAREALYLAAQEALANAVRHGAPAAVTVRLERGGQTAVLTVADDGRGVRAGQRLGGLGLLGMRERVQALAGSVAAGPGSGGRGWSGVVQLPLASEAAAPSRRKAVG